MIIKSKLWFGILLAVLVGCSNSGNSSDGDNNGGDADADGDSDTDGDSDGDSDADGDADWGTDNVCQSTNVDASIDSVYLAFAFDVSGSMGKGDKEWHDVTLKWDPVTAAAKSFLESDSSSELLASMTFFPAADDRCEATTYYTPDVPFTALPSTAFGEAMDEIRDSSWRGGTPTLYVMEGMTQYVKNSRDEVPGKYVIVLVTDGYPQGCDDNDIESVVSVAGAALTDGISTYVIGVQNPPIDGAPETVENLTDVAAAGGTESAFIIDTGNPEQTASDFTAVIDQIRSQTAVCTVSIPAPPDGREFDKQKVRVAYTIGDTTKVLTYDQGCQGENKWYYDNAKEPKSIVLCDSTCETMQNNPDASLSVEFTCTIETIVEIE